VPAELDPDSDWQTSSLLRILALGQLQINRRQFSGIQDVFAELDELDRRDKSNSLSNTHPAK